ncbi:hypothetical protein SNE40_014590 [Patella caerulea]|uniref:Uncharacterized protein n=1 Tax=Patella caerulea TaxID=87958 RepID=A0AAN8PJC6_PATCE
MTLCEVMSQYEDSALSVNVTQSGLAGSVYECDARLESFGLLNIDDVRKIVCAMPDKSCSLDPMPTNLVKSCIDVLAPHLLSIVNSSFSTGVAVICFLLKKAGLDKEVFKNYRPVSNCSFIDKFLEKAALSRLQLYLRQIHCMAIPVCLPRGPQYRNCTPQSAK